MEEKFEQAEIDTAKEELKKSRDAEDAREKILYAEVAGPEEVAR